MVLDWDRCRRRCPSAKPVPPTASGAQLIPYDSAQKWQRQLWEDEVINYGCENASLVIDKVKDQKSVSYACSEDGTYDTPDESAGEKWPLCTEEPIDPCTLLACF